MTTTLEGGEGSASRPSRYLPAGKTRYPLYRRLGRPQDRSAQVGKISPPPGFDPWTVQPVASRYTDCATRPTSKMSGWGEIVIVRSVTVRPLGCIESWGTDFPVTWPYIPEERKPQLHRCQQLRSTQRSTYFDGRTRWCIWLRHCTSSLRVAVSISGGVTGIFH